MVGVNTIWILVKISGSQGPRDLVYNSIINYCISNDNFTHNHPSPTYKLEPFLPPVLLTKNPHESQLLMWAPDILCEKTSRSSQSCVAFVPSVPTCPNNDDIFQLAELVYWCFISHLGVVLIHLRYGGWKKSCTACVIRNPMKHGMKSISTGAGSLPSTAAAENCLTIVLHQYLKFRFHVDLEQNDTKSTWHQTDRNKKNIHIQQ